MQFHHAVKGLKPYNIHLCIHNHHNDDNSYGKKIKSWDLEGERGKKLSSKEVWWRRVIGLCGVYLEALNRDGVKVV